MREMTELVDRDVKTVIVTIFQVQEGTERQTGHVKERQERYKENPNGTSRNEDCSV